MKILCFVGPPGSGKSTVIMKLAARYSVRNKEDPAMTQTVILGFNTWNIGGSFAVEKVANLTGIRYKQIGAAAEISKYTADNVTILIDMPGTLHNEEVYYEFLREVNNAVKEVTFIMVVDANYCTEIISSFIKQYSAVLPISGICYTRCLGVSGIPALNLPDIPPVLYISSDDRIPGELIVL